MEKDRTFVRLDHGLQHGNDPPAAMVDRVAIAGSHVERAALCAEHDVDGRKRIEQSNIVIAHHRMGAERIGLALQLVTAAQVDDGPQAIVEQARDVVLAEPVEPVAAQHGAPRRLAAAGKRVAAEVADVEGVLEAYQPFRGVCRHQRIPDFMKASITCRCRIR